MTITLMLDTNVWVDNYCADHVASPVVRELMSKAYALGATLVYPVGVVKDVFYVLSHEFRRVAMSAGEHVSQDGAQAIKQAVWGCVNNMCELATAVGADEADVWLARKYKGLTGDLEDNLVLVAAQRAKVDYLVTSDQELIRHATVAALSPADMLKVLEARESMA